MAGSAIQFGYFFDTDLSPRDGDRGAILLLDESNQRSLGNNPGAITVGDQPRYIARFTPRYLYWQGINSNGETIRRKIIVTNPSNIYYVQGGDLTLEAYPGTVITGYVTGTVGEKKTFVPQANATGGNITPVDTGITDGTQP